MNADIITINIVIQEMNNTVVRLQINSESDVSVLSNFVYNDCIFEEFYLQRNFLIDGVSQGVRLLPGRTFSSYGVLNGSMITAKNALIPIHILYDFYGEGRVENRLIGVNQKMDCFFMLDLGEYRFRRFFIAETGQEIVNRQALPQAYNIVPHTHIVATDMEIFIHTTLDSFPIKDHRWAWVGDVPNNFYTVDENENPSYLILYDGKTLDPNKTFYEQMVFPKASIVLYIPEEIQKISELQLTQMSPKELYETWLSQKAIYASNAHTADNPTIVPEPATEPSVEPLPITWSDES